MYGEEERCNIVWASPFGKLFVNEVIPAICFPYCINGGKMYDGRAPGRARVATAASPSGINVTIDAADATRASAESAVRSGGGPASHSTTPQAIRRAARARAPP